MMKRSNIKEPVYYKTPEIPQPYTVCYGTATSLGAVDTTRLWLPKRITITKVATGQYRITHGFTNKNYYVIITPATNASYGVAISENTFTVTFAADTAFSFEMRAY